MAGSLREKSVRGVAWSAVERFSLLGVQFVISIILARLLAPSDYGMAAMFAIFLMISRVFIDCGLTNALIQNQQRTECDFATALFFNAAISVFFYALLFAGAPFIADFYEMPDLVPVTRIIGLSLVLSTLSAVHRTNLAILGVFKYYDFFVTEFVNLVWGGARKAGWGAQYALRKSKTGCRMEFRTLLTPSNNSTNSCHQPRLYPPS